MFYLHDYKEDSTRFNTATILFSLVLPFMYYAPVIAEKAKRKTQQLKSKYFSKATNVVIQPQNLANGNIPLVNARQLPQSLAAGINGFNRANLTAVPAVPAAPTPVAPATVTAPQVIVPNFPSPLAQNLANGIRGFNRANLTTVTVVPATPIPAATAAVVAPQAIVPAQPIRPSLNQDLAAVIRSFDSSTLRELDPVAVAEDQARRAALTQVNSSTIFASVKLKPLDPNEVAADTARKQADQKPEIQVILDDKYKNAYGSDPEQSETESDPEWEEMTFPSTAAPNRSSKAKARKVENSIGNDLSQSASPVSAALSASATPIESVTPSESTSESLSASKSTGEVITPGTSVSTKSDSSKSFSGLIDEVYRSKLKTSPSSAEINSENEKISAAINQIIANVQSIATHKLEQNRSDETDEEIINAINLLIARFRPRISEELTIARKTARESKTCELTNESSDWDAEIDMEAVNAAADKATTELIETLSESRAAMLIEKAREIIKIDRQRKELESKLRFKPLM